MRALRYAFDEARDQPVARAAGRAAVDGDDRRSRCSSSAGFSRDVELERLGAEWSRAAEMSVYLNDEVTPGGAASGRGRRWSPGDVVAVARVRLEGRGARRGSSRRSPISPPPWTRSATTRCRPLRSAAAARRRAQRRRRRAGRPAARRCRAWPTCATTGSGWTACCRRSTIIRGVGLVLGAVLTIAAALTVANVVRLALYARRDEMEIMQLVGAPQAYIRGPFVMEGVLQGGVGALLALAALGVAFLALQGRYLAPLASALNLSSIHFLPVELCFLLVVGGMVVGCLGGLVAAGTS